MTMTTPKPTQGAQRTARAGTRIEWTIVQSGLWVATANGEFAGMIEARGSGGFAATHLAEDLGVFATVDEAKASFGQ